MCQTSDAACTNSYSGIDIDLAECCAKLHSVTNDSVLLRQTMYKNKPDETSKENATETDRFSVMKNYPTG